MGDSWPRELSVDEVLGRDGIAGIANDPMLRCMLESGPVRDINLERYLTSLRRFVLDLACEPRKSENVKLSVLRFCSALANAVLHERVHIFAVTPKQMEQAQQLRETTCRCARVRPAISPLLPVAVASYFRLSEVPAAHIAAGKTWPEPVRGVLTQQLVEPAEERRYGETIPRLTDIDDKVSQRVQQQYEENPYPRWVSLVAGREPLGVHEYLRRQFPMASLSSPDSASASEILVAGCGTGQEAIINARRFVNANVLAVDIEPCESLLCQTDVRKVRRR